MLARRIIPCLDVKDGNVVKGTNFSKLKYAGNPAELASRYSGEGADELIFLDVAASVEKRIANRKWISDVAACLNVPFAVGGGFSSVEQIREILSLGADKVCLNTAAVGNHSLISVAAEAFGSQCIVTAIDVKKGNGRWLVYSYGGTVETGLDAVSWAIKCQELGAGEILLTSIDRDGTGLGFDCELVKKVAGELSIPVIASGGAGTEADFAKVFLDGMADAALAAGVFHYGNLQIRELKRYLSLNGIPVRL